MEVIKSFNFNGQSLSVYGTSDKPLFMAKEVSDALGYSNSWDAIKRHVDNDDKTTLVKHEGGFRTLVNESGLYALIFGCKLDGAKKFKKWVTSEVLPSIRRTGHYEMRKPKAYITLTSFFNLSNEREYRIKLITYLRYRRESEIYHLTFTGSMGEILKGDGSDIRKEAVMTGYEKGSSDILITTPSKNNNGCYIELKFGNNELSPEQKYSIEMYKLNDYKIIVAHEWTSLQRQIDDYLREIRLPCKFCSQKFKSNETLKNHHKYFHRIDASK